MPTRVRLFGSPTYRVAGDWLPLPLDKRGALLALLAHAEDGLPRARVVKLFWPEAAPSQGRVNLRGLLMRLRAVEAHSDLSLVGEQLAWRVSCDSRDFRRAVSEERWLDATSLSPAPFLHDMELTEVDEVSAWIDLERQELEVAYKLAARRAAELLAPSGDVPRIDALWRVALERDPYDEAGMESCLRLALRFDTLTTAALRLNEQFAVRMKNDLGVVQPAELERLARELRSRDSTRPGRLDSTPPSTSDTVPLPTVAAAKQQRLPAPTAPLVRRDAEVARVTDLISHHSRAVTILGPGGIGKTQLALQVARNLEPLAQDGCWIVPLVGIDSTDLASTAVAQVVGVHLQGSVGATAQLFAYLRDRVGLLVLDNIEEPPGSGEFIDAVLASSPGLRVLATSRSPLTGAGGVTYELEGMLYPKDATDDQFDDYAAVRLFVLRARQANPRFTLAEADRPALAAICQFVEGAPLGIELAAAWTGALALGNIAAALEVGSPDIARDLQDAPPRHRNLQAAFDHSWRLLSPSERAALAALAVFAGGFTAEAAEHVTACGPSTLATLLGWSLVRRAGDGRFDLHELVRQFAAQRLAADTEDTATVRRRHAEFFASLVEREGRWFRGGASQVRALAAVANELSNVRAAWSHACTQRDHKALEKYLPMFHIYEIKGLYQEGAEAFALSAAALPARSAARARSLTAQSVLLGRLERLEECRAAVDESLAILADLGESDGLTLMHLGVIEYLEGDLDGAVAAWNKTIEVAEMLGDLWSKAGAISNLGQVAWRRGDPDTARQLIGERIERGGDLQDQWGLSMGRVVMGELALELGELAAAGTHLEEGLRIAHGIDQQPVVLKALYLLGLLALRTGDSATAAARFSECVAAGRAGGDPATPAAALQELRKLDGTYSITPS